MKRIHRYRWQMYKIQFVTLIKIQVTVKVCLSVRPWLSFNQLTFVFSHFALGPQSNLHRKRAHHFCRSTLSHVTSISSNKARSNNKFLCLELKSFVATADRRALPSIRLLRSHRCERDEVNTWFVAFNRQPSLAVAYTT